MKYTEKIETAIQIASQAHKNQNRKGNNALPYISHPFSVFVILSEHTDNEDILIAGLLHDVLEDCDPLVYNEQSLSNIFGDRVVSIIKGVSEQKDGTLSEMSARQNWDDRKVNYLQHLKKTSLESAYVSTADKIHNLLMTIKDYNVIKDDLWIKFNAPKDKQSWFYNEFVDTIKDRLGEKNDMYIKLKNLNDRFQIMCKSWLSMIVYLNL